MRSRPAPAEPRRPAPQGPPGRSGGDRAGRSGGDRPAGATRAARATAVAAAHAVLGLINSTPHSARLGRAGTGDLLRRMALRALLATDPPR